MTNAELRVFWLREASRLQNHLLAYERHLSREEAQRIREDVARYLRAAEQPTPSSLHRPPTPMGAASTDSRESLMECAAG